MVGAHAAFTLSDETLAACADLAASTGVGVHVHVAEDALDRDALPRMRRTGLVDERSLLAHCVHVDTNDAVSIHAVGATVAHNARSNMNNGVGRAPVEELGQAVALGTDGIDSDMWAELRAAYFRRREEGIDVGADWPLERLASGARFAGRAFDEPLLGTLEVGAPADLVVLEYDPPTPLATTNLAGHLLFGISPASVRDVLVAGELVVRDRRLVRVDEAELAAHARDQAAALWQRMDAFPAHPFAPAERLLATSGAR
jgi:cytosine/adenosine deaminase-related metal-dependent hydrolase